MNSYKPVIGIEVHVALNTKSKMFSSSPNNHYDKPNTNINEIDLALPGSLPSVNEEGVIKAIELAHTLHMNIDKLLKFDRKNYFYQDLPKGYQITQQYRPIGTKGFIDIGTKKIHVRQIHIEEDTAKQIIENNKIVLDYNRAGIPLIEIVSQPEMNSADEAINYLTQLKRIVSFLEVSDAKMEDGSMRVDVNISLMKQDSNIFGTKVEIKNLNSFANVAKAINYEIKRQSELLKNNKEVVQETRRWDEAKQQTIFMRSKTNVDEYRYFTEPNIISLNLSNDFINNAISNIKNNIDTIKQKLLEDGINDNLINQLLNDYSLFKLFKEANKNVNNPKLCVTWVVIELMGLLNKNKKTIDFLANNQINDISKMLNALKLNSINAKDAKEILNKIVIMNESFESLIKNFANQPTFDDSSISNILEKIIQSNITMLDQYESRPERVEKFFIGMLMKETKGKANPVVGSKILKELIIKFKK